jgi:predicted ATPase
MITRLKLSNFKSHRDSELRFGELTVLTGSNSAGKTSVIHALLLLRQSYQKNRLWDGLELNGALCRIGVGGDALYRFADTNIMSVEVDDENRFRFSYEAGDDLGSSFLRKKEYSDNIAPSTLGKSALFSDMFQYVSSLRLSGVSHFDRYDYEVVERGQISKEFGQGEAVAHFLHKNGAKETFNYIDMSGKCLLADQVCAWEQKISENLTIDVQKNLSGGFDVVYGYKIPGVKPIVDLRAENVGFGISHSLPVITALVSAEPGALLILENPEAHLHPTAQAELARLIARVAQRGVQVVVETHSDHIINGILVASRLFEDVQSGKSKFGIDRHKVRIYYVDKDVETPTCSSLHKVEILEGGRLSYQPRGFFDQAERDMYYLSGFGIGIDEG